MHKPKPLHLIIAYLCGAILLLIILRIASFIGIEMGEIPWDNEVNNIKSFGKYELDFQNGLLHAEA